MLGDVGRQGKFLSIYYRQVGVRNDKYDSTLAFAG